MSEENPLRVMWLINHTAARNFEVPMLKRTGISEIYLPKKFPADPSFRSASVDWSEDANLTIPTADLEALNQVDWHTAAPPEAWELASKYFDVAFIVLQSRPDVLIGASKYFSGVVVWRCYGLQADMSYHRVLQAMGTSCFLERCIHKLGRRFVFGEAYSHLADKEPEYLSSRRRFLPLGLPDISISNSWHGSRRRIFFVCPDIGFSAYYEKIYRGFVDAFGDLPHSIAGTQTVPVFESDVLGYVSAEQHQENMNAYRLMFYHSTEPNHIHYHPFEAIRAGMPLVFMAGGMLDRLGGTGLPGRCESISEARRKIRKILDGKRSLIDQIRRSQGILLEQMQPDLAEPHWRHAFERIRWELAVQREQNAINPFQGKRKKIAVILPESYRGGTLRGAKLMAEALYLGSRHADQPADITLFYPDTDCYKSGDYFSDFPDDIPRRPFTWRIVSANRARRAMRYAGFEMWEPSPTRYIFPDDGAAQLQDYDLWLFISDRLSYPVIPMKPIALLVFDYLQRYEPVMAPAADIPFLNAAYDAQRVFVTTDFTYRDAVQYAGVNPENVRKLPMLAPEFPLEPPDFSGSAKNYFLWTTNATVHKNLENAARALAIYYEQLDGSLDCWVTGVDTNNLLQGDLPHLKAVEDIFADSELLAERVKFQGELPDPAYRSALRDALFLWHAGHVDNGTFTVIEAARLGVPALSSDYPAMREIDRQFALNLAWMEADQPAKMAEQLKMMERDALDRRHLLPATDQWQGQSVKALAPAYWQQVRQCL